MSYAIYVLVLFVCLVPIISKDYLFDSYWDPYNSKYGYFSEKERLEMLDAAKNMFYFGYDNYMQYAYPEDELNPIDCTGRGHDIDNP